MDLKTLKAFSLAGALVLCCAVFSGAVSAQPAPKQYVADFGAAFTQATVTKAQMGMLGLDLSVGKMIIDGLSVGIAVGHDVVSYRKNGEIHERLAIVPILAKAKYYYTIVPSMSVHASVAGGGYQTIPHLGTDEIGGVSRAEIKPGGGIGLGFDYWLFGSHGLGVEFEYHFIDTGGEDLFSYCAARLNYSIIKM
jgi:hypothetical protein